MKTSGAAASSKLAIVPSASARGKSRAKAGGIGSAGGTTVANPYAGVTAQSTGVQMHEFNLNEKELHKYELEWKKWCKSDSSRTCSGIVMEGLLFYSVVHALVWTI